MESNQPGSKQTRDMKECTLFIDAFRLSRKSQGGKEREGDSARQREQLLDSWRSRPTTHGLTLSIDRALDSLDSANIQLRLSY